MVTLEIKENSKQAKAFIALAKTLSFVNFKEKGKEKHVETKTENYPVSKNVPNEETDRILRENERNGGKGRKKFDNLEELIEELNS